MELLDQRGCERHTRLKPSWALSKGNEYSERERIQRNTAKESEHSERERERKRERKRNRGPMYNCITHNPDSAGEYEPDWDRASAESEDANQYSIGLQAPIRIR